MSLTSQLQNSSSPIRAYIDGVSPWLSATGGNSPDARIMSRALGLSALSTAPLIVPGRSTSITAATIGTAFDFRARIDLGAFDPNTSNAGLGIHELPMIAESVENGDHRMQIIMEAFTIAQDLLESPAKPHDFDRASIILAYCEQIYRVGSKVFNGSLGMLCDAASSGVDLVEGTDYAALEDLDALLWGNRNQLAEWRSLTANGQLFNPNPTFSGSRLVGGADADWITGDTLIECKVYQSLTIPTLRNFIRQLLGYVLLDLDDASHIRSIGVWLPRQQQTVSWSLEILLGGNPEELLPILRIGFEKATTNTQLALRTPVTMRRKRHLLADNRHTPSTMLERMSFSADESLRFRVARNLMTPETTIRRLRRDPAWNVRDGVAQNPNAPQDVLESLARDRSITVRRSVANHPSIKCTRTATLDIPATGTAAVKPEIATNPTTLITRGAAGSALQLTQRREDEDLDSSNAVWIISQLLSTWSPGGGLPEATRMWMYRTGRKIDTSQVLQGPLPRAVIDYLMHPEHHAGFRKFAAKHLPISDSDARSALLKDVDPEIRWEALERTTASWDDEVSTLLGELATNKKVRSQFRTAHNTASAEYTNEVLELVARHPGSPVEILEGLLTTSSAEVLLNLADNPTLPNGSRAPLIERMLALKSRSVREHFSDSANTPSEVLDALAENKDAQIRSTVSRNLSTPMAALTRLVADAHDDVRLGVLVNSSTPSSLAAKVALEFLTSSDEFTLEAVLEILRNRIDVNIAAEIIEDALDRLAKSRKFDYRKFVALDIRSTSVTLARLAKSSDSVIREAVARNTRTSANTLKLMVNDVDKYVRLAVARNIVTDPTTLTILAEDSEASVRCGVAGNQHSPEAALRELLSDQRSEVSAAAAENPAATYLIDLSHEVSRQAPPRSRSREALVEMAANTRAEVRIRVAYDINTPPDILIFLSDDRRSTKVRRTIAAHPKATPTMLKSLVQDKDFEVRANIALNASTPIETLRELAASRIDLAMWVALNPNTPFELLNQLANDDEVLIRYISTSALVERRRKAIESSETTAE